MTVRTALNFFQILGFSEYRKKCFPSLDAVNGSYLRSATSAASAVKYLGLVTIHWSVKSCLKRKYDGIRVLLHREAGDS